MTWCTTLTLSAFVVAVFWKIIKSIKKLTVQTDPFLLDAIPDTSSILSSSASMLVRTSPLCLHHTAYKRSILQPPGPRVTLVKYESRIIFYERYIRSKFTLIFVVWVHEFLPRDAFLKIVAEANHCLLSCIETIYHTELTSILTSQRSF